MSFLRVSVTLAVHISRHLGAKHWEKFVFPLSSQDFQDDKPQSSADSFPRNLLKAAFVFVLSLARSQKTMQRKTDLGNVHVTFFMGIPGGSFEM